MDVRAQGVSVRARGTRVPARDDEGRPILHRALSCSTGLYRALRRQGQALEAGGDSRGTRDGEGREWRRGTRSLTVLYRALSRSTVLYQALCAGEGASRGEKVGKVRGDHEFEDTA